jgi:hypothetical protein
MKLTIFKLVRDPKAHHKIIGKDTLRVVNVHPTFAGITSKGEANKAEFQELANALEPYNDGISLS